VTAARRIEAGEVSGALGSQTRRVLEAIGGFATWSGSRSVLSRLEDPLACDFLFGNPQEAAPAAYVDALLRATRPEGDPMHFAYKMNEPEATRAVAEGLRARFGMPFEADDVFMTNGNFAGLSIVLRTIADPGDEVVFISPPWFFYETLILATGLEPRRVYADPGSFDLDLDAISAALGPRTRAVIVNSPNNPTGRIYPPSTLSALAAVLDGTSARNRRRVYLLSDEAYNHILLDGQAFPTPTAYYPHSFLLYTYAKTLLSPGSRLGYIAVPPSMPEREELRTALLLGQIATGWAFPVAPLQYAVPELERMEADVEAYRRRRDVLVPALREAGYEPSTPEGTFYVIARSPLEDDLRFFHELASRGVYVLPGSMFEMPGWFRLSLTANDDMIERAMPILVRARKEVRS
jgi:aspartate aminotransferase